MQVLNYSMQTPGLKYTSLRPTDIYIYIGMDNGVLLMTRDLILIDVERGEEEQAGGSRRVCKL